MTRGYRTAWWLPVLIVFLDQLTKTVVKTRLAPYESHTVIDGIVAWTRVHNTGAAFGFLDAMHFPHKPIILSIIAAGALIALAAYGLALDRRQRLSRLGLTIIIGGAAGNLIDRVTLGYVLDFIDVSWNGWHFWTFNVADAAINIGVGLVILDLLGVGRAPATTPALDDGGRS